MPSEKTKLKILSKSPAHFRIECGCGKFIHELKAGENGEPVFDTFIRNTPAEDAPPPEPAKKPKKKKSGWGFWEEDEEEDEEEQEGA